MRKTRTPQTLSKLLAYVLGRRPDEFGLLPDAEGFVKIKDLLKALHEEAGWGYVNPSHLNEVVLSVPDASVEISQDRIRARNRDAWGREVLSPTTPKLLYACIRRRAYPHVHLEGLHPSSHPRVVLAADRAMAERLGRRIDSEPVILTVNVQCARERGIQVDQCGENLYLADHIPADCFSGPPLPKAAAEEARKAPAAEAPHRPATPGSFLMDAKRATRPPVPASRHRFAEKGRNTERRRRKSDRWKRERPPWKN
jgi:putative RNA 2'-phosphotransferase